ncbi:MAG: hypothetical protein MRY21_05965 [Simkaniaceae bacterium]|nr:hypothetical protein [Simkaniaceae bacterium]
MWIQLEGELFDQVQKQEVFQDSKTFVDAIPKAAPEEILIRFKSADNLEHFVAANFELPETLEPQVEAEDIDAHIDQVWGALTRELHPKSEYDSLLDLPHPHIVPGGRFREAYYWDSYFTALGISQEMLQNLIENFAHLIDTYGHIPNGNRQYYLSRSQQPFFSHLLELYESRGGDIEAYLPALEKEYLYWNAPHRVDAKTGLNHYWDEKTTPREESYREDLAVTQDSETYRHLRAACESGWDFSSRWCRDPNDLSSIETVHLLPVDLNSLLYHMEKMLARVESSYGEKAAQRAQAIERYLYSEEKGHYVDYNWKEERQNEQLTAATMAPLFVSLAKAERAERVASVVKSSLLGPGGLATTLEKTGQQWDYPNGWAPLQWIGYQGLKNYGQTELARELAKRWLQSNETMYKRVGKMLEKYAVDRLEVEAGGGEYSLQEGFGWTNGVYLQMKRELQ